MNANSKICITLALIVIFFAGFASSNIQQLKPIRDTFHLDDNVEYTLVKYGQTTPDLSLVTRGWNFIGWTDGSATYKFSTHNLVTNGGQNRTACRVHNYNASGSCASETAGTARYIAVTNDAVAPAYTDTACTGEITTGGLARASGTVNIPTPATGDVGVTIRVVFSATATNSVQKGCLMTDTIANGGGLLWAYTTFTSVTVNNGDTLTVTWTVNYNN